MRIFWHSGNQNDSLQLLHQTVSLQSFDFPTEIIRKIVDYLPRSSLPAVAGINHAWYTSTMPVLCRHIYIRTFSHWALLQRTFEQEGFGTRFGPHVSSLVLKPSPALISAQLTSALNLRVVENDDILQPTTKGYVRLERVNYDLTGLEDIENENRTQILNTSAKEAEWLSFVTDNQVCRLLDFCYNLEYLDLSGCERLTDEALLPVYKQKLSRGKQRPVRLKGIWLHLIRNITSTSLTNLVHVDRMFGLSELKYLNLEFLVSLNDRDIELMLSHFGSSLTHLQLNSAYELTNASIRSITKYCPHLKLLYLTRCWRIDNEGMTMLSKHCKQLEYLSVSFLNSVNEDGLIQLVRNGKLVWLNITGCGINALFKHLILESWKVYRIENHLAPLFIFDEKLNLI